MKRRAITWGVVALLAGAWVWTLTPAAGAQADLPSNTPPAYSGNVIPGIASNIPLAPGMVEILWGSGGCQW